MFVRLGRFRTVLCLVFFLGSQAEVKVVEKAYQNVVVSFSPRLSPENATHLVSSLQGVLKDTSSVLQEAIGLRIRSVTFKLPSTWKDVSLEGISPASGSDGQQQHDIHVEALSDSAFGKHPHTIQYGGCGIPGIEISIPEVFLAEDENYPKGKILAKEWLKYRYGVFDENGFPNDPMYPTHYTIAGNEDIHVTDCTFPKVEYEFRDSDENNCTLSSETESNCFIYPNQETAENVSSSLMFYHEKLPNVDHICGTGDHSHNEDSPNKQNLLCFYKSIWEIVKTSGDFTVENQEGADEDQDITYYYVKESPARLVLTWQNSDDLKTQGRTVLNVMWKLLHDLSLVDNKVAIYSFKDEDNSKEIRQLSELTQDNFKNVMLYAEFNTPVEQPCATCAVDKAVDVLLEDSKEEPGTILLITTANPPKDYLNERLNNSKLCVIVIGFEGASEEEWSNVIGQSACSVFKKISTTEPNKIFQNVYETIEVILPLPADDTRITTVTTDIMTKDTDFVIPADENAALYMLWIFDFKDDDGIQCTVEDQIIKHSKNETSSTQSLSAFRLDPAEGDIKCRFKFSDPVLAQAQMKSKPGAYFNFHAWKFDTTPKNETVQMPVIIYASLSYGQYPVLNAEVKAIVTHVDGHINEFQLLDNGLGDPDVTQNDGIYSGYFTEFVSEGSYEVEVHANEKDQQTKIGKQGQDPCCGSIVMNEAFNMSSFKLISKTNFEAISKKPEKGYKPSRVVDLKVDKLDFPKSVSLKWTAPGGEMDRGQAFKYDFLIFCQHKDCNSSGILPNWITLSNNPKPQEFGKEEKITLAFSEIVPEDIVIYITLKAISKGLQPADLSNAVAVKLSPGETLEEITTPVTTVDKVVQGAEAGVIVAYVMIALACLILIAGVVYFVLEKKRRHRIPHDLNTPEGFGVGNDNKAFNFQSPPLQKENAMERAESLPVQLYTHDQIKDIRQKQKDSPKQRSGQTPKSWLSLDALSGDVKNIDKRSVDSASITQIDLKKTNEEEIKQLDNISQKSVPIVERNSKF